MRKGDGERKTIANAQIVTKDVQLHAPGVSRGRDTNSLIGITQHFNRQKLMCFAKRLHYRLITLFN